MVLEKLVTDPDGDPGRRIALVDQDVGSRNSSVLALRSRIPPDPASQRRLSFPKTPYRR